MPEEVAGRRDLPLALQAVFADAQGLVPQLRCGYVGETKDGRQHGRGTHVYTNGDVYQGSWYEGQIHGRGTYTYANGVRYDGEFRSCVRHGKGTYHMLNGDVFEGDWVDGKRTGHGTMHYGGLNAGEQYTGSFRDSKRDGRGRYAYANGDVYDGQWVADKKQGDGSFHYANGDAYEGQWLEDHMHGLGTLHWRAAGVRYHGLFDKGQVAGAFCAASPRDTAGVVQARACSYVKGQCRQCGQFNTPCPVQKPGEPPASCSLVNGACSRCGKTDKFRGFKPDTSFKKPKRKHQTSKIETPPADPPTTRSTASLRSPTGSDLVHRAEQPQPQRGPARELNGAAKAVKGAAALDGGAPGGAEAEAEAGGSESPAAARWTASDPSTNPLQRDRDVAPLVRRARELLAGCRCGLGMAIADFAAAAGENHVKVVTVKSASPAGGAGVRRNDRILSFCERAISSKAVFLSIARDLTPGESKVLEVERGGLLRQLKVRAGANLSESDYNFLQQIAAGKVAPSDAERVTSIRHAPGAVSW
ncbi:Phosphatidylinositol 4-phosphate 5-kinase 6 [Diplonema papillatum]|nr:Phosphatidylinositol 4-phosphate 5-kinase 6 [Diplonema papillatum]